jgi:xylan 1,4-beta-xylosidase
VIEVHAGAQDPGVPLHHLWSVSTGAGRAAEGLRSDWQEQLARVNRELGYRYVRFHGLFHDDMFLYDEDRDGLVVLDFASVDALVDRLLEIGVRPFVELAFCPGKLARTRATTFWWGAHGSPPIDLGRWAELVAGTIAHWIDRYGRNEVRTWYFEVWNEPNIHPFWDGSRSEYFELYQASVEAVRGVDPQLRVGGPATSNFVPDTRFDGETEDVAAHSLVRDAKDLDALEWKPVWLDRFLEFCADRSLPLDFISCHPYPTDWALDGHGESLKLTRGRDATRLDLEQLGRIRDASAYPDAELHITEWNSSSSSRDHTHDQLPAATFVARANIAAIGLVDSLTYWTFTDIFFEQGAGRGMFHGGFGLLTARGIPKPTYHAYRFLHSLGDELLARTAAAVLSRDSTTGRLSALVTHYPPEVTRTVPGSFDSREVAEQTMATGAPESLSVALTDLPPGAAFEIETIDARHGNAIHSWRLAGSPDNPTREQTALIARESARGMTERVRADEAGRLMLRRRIAPWALVSVRQLAS